LKPEKITLGEEEEEEEEDEEGRYMGQTKCCASVVVFVVEFPVSFVRGLILWFQQL
jgi:hypothetical protein